MSLKNRYNNLCFHPNTFDDRQKSLSYLTSLSRRGLLNPSIPTFGNISLTKISLI